MTFKTFLQNTLYLLLSIIALGLAVIIVGIMAKAVVYLFLAGYRLF